MGFLWKTDWGRLFVPEMSLLEILIRGTLIYLALCLLLRVVLKRQAGKVSLSDLLVVSVVAGVCRNPLVKDAYSITDGVLVVAVVLFWSFAVDWLSFYVPVIHKLTHESPVLLIRDGQVLKENLRRELMTESQLQCKLRRVGVKEPAEVAEAWMEGDGQVSVIKEKETRPAQKEPTYEPASGEGPRGTGSHRAEDQVRNNVTSKPSPPTPAEIQAFLEVAWRLQDQIARHRQAIAEHQRGIVEAQEALRRCPFRLKTSARGRKTDCR